MRKTHFGILTVILLAAMNSILVAATPTAYQAAWQDLEVGVFFHCARSSTYENFNPDAWANAAVDAGARYIIMVAKHGEGFCWWPTATTTNSVKSMVWKGGKGDVVGELFTACRAKGLKVGFYLCSHQDNTFGDIPSRQAEYNRYYCAQLTELCTQYGEICEVWNDGGFPPSLDSMVHPILEQYQPQAMVQSCPHLNGLSRSEEWVPNPFYNTVGGMWRPMEVDIDMANGSWFDKIPRSTKFVTGGTSSLERFYYGSVGHGGNLLINIPPAGDGSMPVMYADTAKAFGDLIRSRVGFPLADTSGIGSVLQMNFPNPVEIDHVVSQEDILAGGERVTNYVIEGLVTGTWQTLVTGQMIGHKKIDRLASPIIVNGVRLRCLTVTDTPMIRSLYVTRTGVMAVDSTPPTVPAGLAAQAVSAYDVRLSWSASTDTGSGVACYRIYRDGARIASVNGTTLFYLDTAAAENTAYSYAISAVNYTSTESVRSGSVSTTTPLDTVPPTILSVSLETFSDIKIHFSEAIDTASGGDKTHYAIDRGVSVLSAGLSGDGSYVLLSTTPIVEAGQYVLTVNDIRDRGATPNSIASNTAVSFTPNLVPKNYWAFDEGEGVVAHDSMFPAGSDSIHGNCSWTQGKKGNALRLSGINSYVDLGNAPDFQSNFTICAWVLPETTGIAQFIVAREKLRVVPYMFGLYLANNNTLVFHETDDKGTGISLETSKQIPSGVWSHVAVSARDTVYSLFVNGTLAARAVAARFVQQPFNPYNVWVGARLNDADNGPIQCFKGCIDDLRMYGRALSVEDLNIVMANLGTSVDAAQVGGQEVRFGLSSAPNPFNPESRIAFALPLDGRATLAVYDIKGRLVRTLADGSLKAGTHRVVWDAKDDNGLTMSTGLYVYRLTAGERTLMLKSILAK